MPSSKKQINARITEPVYDGLEWLMQHLGMSKAEAIRYCIVETCKQHGRNVEDDMPKPGTYDRES